MCGPGARAEARVASEDDAERGRVKRREGAREARRRRLGQDEDEDREEDGDLADLVEEREALVEHEVQILGQLLRIRISEARPEERVVRVRVPRVVEVLHVFLVRLDFAEDALRAVDLGHNKGASLSRRRDAVRRTRPSFETLTRDDHLATSL